MKADCSDSGSCLKEMLRIWLKRVDPKPSWRELIEALNDLGEEKRADDIRRKPNNIRFCVIDCYIICIASIIILLIFVLRHHYRVSG